ncbi:hypothetical protein Tco_0412468 [Tanacetum coccineum]
MSSASSAVTYTSVHTDFEPGKAFWGADDEEISDGGIPRVITPSVPQDEDEREPMFVQVHDPDYVPDPVYPEYIPLEDEHVFLAEEQPLPPVDLPTAESPGYITESDPEEDPEEYEDDETGEMMEMMMTAIHLGMTPMIRMRMWRRARIIVRPQASISLPSEAEVERLLAMTTPSPSPPISLLPPSVGERLARYTAPPTHSSPPLVPSPLLLSFGCLTQIQMLRITSTQALINAVTTALPSPTLPPLPPSLYIPPLVDHRDDVPESELLPRKRLCLSTLGSRYEIEESSTARPTKGQGVDYGFVSIVDAEARWQGISKVGYGIRDTWVDPAEAVSEVAPMTVREVNTRVTELAELHERDTQDLYALLEDAQDGDSIDCGGGGLCFSRGLGSPIGLSTLIQRYNVRAQMVETLHVMRDMRREMGDTQAELLAMRDQRRRARQPTPDARIPDH